MSDTSDREFVITRLLRAPCARVFAAWTSPAEVDLWMGPDDFVTTTISMDVRVGGLWRYTMSHPVHGTFPNRIAYLTVEPLNRLEYLHGTDDEPDQFHVTVTFEAQSAETLLTMRGVFPTAEVLEQKKRFGAIEMGHQTMRRLAVHVES